MKKLLIAILIPLTLTGCMTGTPQQVRPSIIDLTPYIGHDEKEIVSLITEKAGAPKIYAPLEGGSCYFWSEWSHHDVGLKVLFKNGKFHSYSATYWHTKVCPEVKDVGKPVKVDY